MSITQKEISNTFDLMQQRSDAPKLTPEQLNAIDLLILGKTDKEVSEAIGVRRETVTRWHKNAFFIAELNARREALWTESKLRLKALVYDAVDVLTNGLKSSDEKIKITAAVHILKTVGVYGEVKGDFGPTTPERAVWDQRTEKELQIYMALRPDSFCDWSVKHHMEECAQEDTHKTMKFWYECAVDEQKKELKDYKKRLKAQEASRIELAPMTIEPLGESSIEQYGQDESTRGLEAVDLPG
jgi:DNA-binding CsgD family transcriptional regulator